MDGGEPVTFTATVTPTDGGGTVAFTDNNTTIAGCGAVPLTAAGQATCTMVSQGPEHTLIEAIYSGDANFLGTNLGSLLQNVTAATSTAITSSVNPSAAGQAVTYTATLTPATQGTISFTDNGERIGSLPPRAGQLRQGDVHRDLRIGGPHAVQAAYSGWSGLSSYAPSTSRCSASRSPAGGELHDARVVAQPDHHGRADDLHGDRHRADLSGTVLFTDGGIRSPGARRSR